MGKNKHAQRRKKLVQATATALALLVMVVPVALTGLWLYTSNANHDQRKVSSVVLFNVRDIDRPNTPLRPFHEPLVSITFDDGWESVYTNAFPILQRYGFSTTQYVISGALDDPNYMSVAQLRIMQAAGTEIGSHTVTHPDLTTLDDAHVAYELTTSQKTLQHDFSVPIRDFTSPYGAYNAYTLAMIGQYYRSQKNAEGAVDSADDVLNTVNTMQNFSPLNVSSFSITSTTKLSDIQRLINETRRLNGWLVITYHQVEDNSDDQYNVTPKDFIQQMQLLNTTPMRSATFGQVMDAIQREGK